MQMWQSLWDNGARGGEQIAQAIWSLSTGGVFGTGLGLGDTSYVAAGHTDLMLAAIGEELGFVGLLAVAASLRSSRRAASRSHCARRTTTDSSSPRSDVVPDASGARDGRRDARSRPADRRGDTVPQLRRLGDGGQLHRAGHADRHSESVALPYGHVLADVPTPASPNPSASASRASSWDSAPRPCIIAHRALRRAGDSRRHIRRRGRTSGIQADGVRRYQYNQRLTDVLATIPRGTVSIDEVCRSRLAITRSPAVRVRRTRRRVSRCVPHPW